MKNYLFITNGSKNCDYESKDDIELRNMSKCCIEPALGLGFNVFMSYNRKYADQIKVKNYNIKLYDASIYRNIFNIKDNYRAYKQLNKFLDNHNIDVIHCNTPIGGALGRICGSKHCVKKIIYTSHGFHFYRGNNPFKNFIFKTIEKHLAKKTDVIITINQEDYEAANKFKLKKGGKVFLTHGVGIDFNEYRNVKIDSREKRKELGLRDDDIVIISTGDLIKRKNYSLALDVIAECDNSKIKYIICGNGPELVNLKRKAEKLKISEQVLFLGYRSDVKELLRISDIFLFTTKQEGLPRSLMEAMASNLPCVVSNIRGNIDLIDDGRNGYVCKSLKEYVNAINNSIGAHSSKNRYKFSQKGLSDCYSFENVKNEVELIYEQCIINNDAKENSYKK